MIASAAGVEDPHDEPEHGGDHQVGARPVGEGAQRPLEARAVGRDRGQPLVHATGLDTEEQQQAEQEHQGRHGTRQTGEERTDQRHQLGGIDGADRLLQLPGCDAELLEAARQ